MARASTKFRLREEFMLLVLDQMKLVRNHTGFSEDYESDGPELDFKDMFNRVLHMNGVLTKDFDENSFDFLIWDEEDEANNKYTKFIASILNAYSRNGVEYMNFLEFVVNRNHELARMVFRHDEFNIAYCLIYDTFSIKEFKRIAAWDLEIGSDIFRNNNLPVLWYACDAAFISNDAFSKMQELVLSHGSDILLWTCCRDDRTNVNIFLNTGYIMNTEPCHRMEQKLNFIINRCIACLTSHGA